MKKVLLFFMIMKFQHLKYPGKQEILPNRRSQG